MKKMISLVCLFGFLFLLASSAIADEPKIPKQIPKPVPLDKSRLKLNIAAVLKKMGISGQGGCANYFFQISADNLCKEMANMNGYNGESAFSCIYSGALGNPCPEGTEMDNFYAYSYMPAYNCVIKKEVGEQCPDSIPPIQIKCADGFIVTEGSWNPGWSPDWSPNNPLPSDGKMTISCNQDCELVSYYRCTQTEFVDNSANFVWPCSSTRKGLTNIGLGAPVCCVEKK